MDFVLTWDVMRQAPEGWHSHLPVIWDEFETAPGVYNFSKLDAWMAKRSDPVHVALTFYFNDLVDHTPSFHKATHVLTVNGETAEMPGYDNPEWVDAYVRAVEALLDHCRSNPQVDAFWLALGVDQETLAVKDRKGVPFAAAGARVMTVYQYLEFIETLLQRVSAAAGTIPVYAEAAPAPGEPWGKNLRAHLANMLSQYHVGYKMNGLMIDQSDACGTGDDATATVGKYDMSWYAPYCAFEPRDEGGGKDPMELYWLIMHAADWSPRFVSLQASWLEHYVDISDDLPESNTDFLVFRGAEYPDILWGLTGDSGNWGRNMHQLGAGDLTYNAKSVGFDRWKLTVGPDGCAIMTPLTYTGKCHARFYTIDDNVGMIAENVTVDVLEGVFDLPLGTYHRVDFFRDQFVEESRTLPSDENPQALGDVARVSRWYQEEAIRQLEEQLSESFLKNNYGMQILYDLVNQKTGLAYRLERATNGASDE